MVQGIPLFTAKTDRGEQAGKSFQEDWLFTKEHRVDGLILLVEERQMLKSIIITVVKWQVKM